MTATQPDNAEFRCARQSCGNILGYVLNGYLYIYGAVYIKDTIDIYCNECNYRTRFYANQQEQTRQRRNER